MTLGNTMAKVDLGEKRVCPECESKFYDLTKRPAVCPMCGFSFNPDELAAKPIPTAPLKPEMNDEDEEDDAKEIDEDDIDEDDIDEDEEAAKELELDGDDAAIIGTTTDDDDDDTPDMDGFSTDEDEDADAALVDDDGDELPPTGDEDDDVEEIEI